MFKPSAGMCMSIMRVGGVQDVLPGFGALLVGYARQRRCAEAVALLRRFNHIGGVPDKFMLETVLTACLTSGEVRPAPPFPPNPRPRPPPTPTPGAFPATHEQRLTACPYVLCHRQCLACTRRTATPQLKCLV